MKVIYVYIYEFKYTKQVRDDFRKINVSLDEKAFVQMSEVEFKIFIKNKVRERSFENLKSQLLGLKKVQLIKFEKFIKPQEYLTHEEFDDDMRSLLFNVRCQTVKGIKDHFHGMYDSYECVLCGYERDGLDHLIECIQLMSVPRSLNIKYEHIYGTVMQQKEVTRLYCQLLLERERLLQ